MHHFVITNIKCVISTTRSLSFQKWDSTKYNFPKNTNPNLNIQTTQNQFKFIRKWNKISIYTINFTSSTHNNSTQRNIKSTITYRTCDLQLPRRKAWKIPSHTITSTQRHTTKPHRHLQAQKPPNPPHQNHQIHQIKTTNTYQTRNTKMQIWMWTVPGCAWRIARRRRRRQRWWRKPLLCRSEYGSDERNGEHEVRVWWRWS